MSHRLLKEHKPIDDYLRYYESLSCLATSYKWSAVYDVHTAHTYEIETATAPKGGVPLTDP